MRKIQVLRIVRAKNQGFARFLTIFDKFKLSLYNLLYFKVTNF